MPLIDDARSIYAGVVPAIAVYRGPTLVWPAWRNNAITASLKVHDRTVVRLTIEAEGQTPVGYKAWGSINGGAWTAWGDPVTGITDYDTGTWNCTVRIKVTADYPGYSPDITVETNTVSIGSRPIKQSTTPNLGCIEWASYGVYGGVTQKRTDWTGTNGGNPAAMYGYVSTNHNQQQSQVRFNIPAAVRGCISVDSVKIRWWNKHHYKGTGGTVSMVGHHNQSLSGSAFGGSTGALLFNGNQAKWSAPINSWINGTEWYELAHLTAPYGGNNRTIAEEIRIASLQGFGLVAAETGTAGYGYASLDPILEITYTHYN